LTRLDWFLDLREQYKKDRQFSQFVNDTRLNQVSDEASTLKEDIFRTIIRIYGELSSEAENKAVEMYRELFFVLLTEASNDPRVLPIFTTNYDLTFEVLRDGAPDFKICNGLTWKGEYRVWDPLTYENGDYSFAIFRLHGCSHWVRRVDVGDIVFQPAPDRDDLTAREPTILYPGPGKSVDIHRDPFQTAYKYLAMCLKNANTVLIIGYSGRDEAIQARLREALAVDPGKRFIVVTKHDELPNYLAAIFSDTSVRITHLRGGIERSVGRIVDVFQGTLSKVALAPMGELRAAYDTHHTESGKQFPPEKQCQCEECKEYRARTL